MYKRTPPSVVWVIVGLSLSWTVPSASWFVLQKKLISYGDEGEEWLPEAEQLQEQKREEEDRREAQKEELILRLPSYSPAPPSFAYPYAQVGGATFSTTYLLLVCIPP